MCYMLYIKYKISYISYVQLAGLAIKKERYNSFLNKNYIKYIENLMNQEFNSKDNALLSLLWGPYFGAY